LISEIPHALSAICDALADHPTLEELDLSDNAFGGRCAENMVNFLETNQSVQRFKLNNNGMGPAGGTIIANANCQECRDIESTGKDIESENSSLRKEPIGEWISGCMGKGICRPRKPAGS